MRCEIEEEREVVEKDCFWDRRRVYSDGRFLWVEAAALVYMHTKLNMRS